MRGIVQVSIHDTVLYKIHFFVPHSPLKLISPQTEGTPRVVNHLPAKGGKFKSRVLVTVLSSNVFPSFISISYKMGKGKKGKEPKPAAANPRPANRLDNPAIVQLVDILNVSK